jgi:hypothetical protein
MFGDCLGEGAVCELLRLGRATPRPPGIRIALAAERKTRFVIHTEMLLKHYITFPFLDHAKAFRRRPVDTLTFLIRSGDAQPVVLNTPHILMNFEQGRNTAFPT